MLSVFSFLFLLMPVSPALAQSPATPDLAQPFHLSITPPVAYIQVKPGEQFSHTIEVRHLGSVPLNITAKLVDFSAGESGQGIELAELSTFPYLTTDSKNQLNQPFELQPGQSHKLTLEFDPPAAAVHHEYHLSLLLTGQSQLQSTGEVGAAVTGTIGSNMVVLVSADQRNLGQMNLKQLDSPKFIDSLGSLTFKVLAENTGATALAASGSAKIINWQGKTVAEYNIYPDMVLAHSQRLLRPTKPATDSAQPSLQATENPEFRYQTPFLIGPYTISVTLSNPDQDHTALSYQVLALPFSVIALVLIAGSLYLGYSAIRRKLPLVAGIKRY